MLISLSVLIFLYKILIFVSTTGGDSVMRALGCTDVECWSAGVCPRLPRPARSAMPGQALRTRSSSISVTCLFPQTSILVCQSCADGYTVSHLIFTHCGHSTASLGAAGDQSLHSSRASITKARARWHTGVAVATVGDRSLTKESHLP